MSEHDPRPEKLTQRVVESIQRDELPLQDDRGKMKFVMNNLILHIHPSKVSSASLKFNYTWGLGGLALMLLALLAISGVMLMFVYTPTPEEAYQDMLTLQTEVWFGQFIRNLHHWSGNLLMLVAFFHMLRVFFTGAFRNPREFNWVMGMVLLLLVVGANFTGYLLPWDQLAYWAVTVGSSLLGYIPLIGDEISRLILGGPEVGAATLTNFYGLHIAVIPLMMFGIAMFHIWRVRKDKFSTPRTVEGDEIPGERVTTIPNLLGREVVFAVVMLALILLWASWVNAPLEEAANPDHSPNPAKAAWYFMGLQELLLHFHPIFGAIVIPGLALLGMASVPYVRTDMNAEGIWFRSRKGRQMAVFSVLFALVTTPLFVVLDEYFIDIPALLPSLPSIISNGWIPLAGLLLLLLGYYGGIKRAFKATACEARLSVFTLLVVSFVILTIIGIAFRGEGMALMWPWEVL